MEVAYLTTYYNGEVDGRFGRFHDWIHTLRDMENPPFEFDVIAFTASNPDETLSSHSINVLGEATELWGSPLNNVEFLINSPRVLRDLLRKKYDIVHVLTVDPIAFPLALSVSNLSPIIGPDIQGYFPGREGDRWEQSGLQGIKLRLFYYFRKIILRASKFPTLISLSKYHKQNLQKLSPHAEVHEIPPGVDEIFSSKPDTAAKIDTDRPTRFLYVGDFSEYKGVYIFLKALSLLPNSMNYEATLIGSGNISQRKVKQYGLKHRVDIEGFVPRERLPAYYRSSDFLVMPSVDENGPNTIVESLACGTPVIATDKPGINEYAPEGTAIYADRSPTCFCQAMIEGHECRKNYKQTAVEHSDKFTAKQTIEKLVELYREHINSVTH